METISNMATAAAQAVWPNNNKDAYHQEPVSGETGNVSKGEPYDAGNIGETKDEEVKPKEHTEPAESKDVPHASEVKDSSAAPGDSTKAQNDTRDPSDAQTKPAEAEKRQNVDDSKGGTDDDSNPVKVDGPGPKPIEEVAKSHHGDAGNVGKEGGDDAGEGGDAAAAAKEGEDDEDEDGPQKKSHGEGTGEQYVKSSGLNADGGDFDATKPGAGKEADRLLEQKGGHNPAADAGKSQPVEETDTKETKEKKSFGQKIKEKLKVGHSSS